MESSMQSMRKSTYYLLDKNCYLPNSMHNSIINKRFDLATQFFYSISRKIYQYQKINLPSEFYFNYHDGNLNLNKYFK